MNRDDIPPERNAFPDEVDDHKDSGMPRQLRTQADKEEALSRIEAEVAGVVPETTVYGDSSYFPNADDQKDVNKSGDGEHL